MAKDKSELVYIRIPVANGRYEYVPVELSRLKPGIYQDLWKKNSVSDDNGAPWQPHKAFVIQGAEAQEAINAFDSLIDELKNYIDPTDANQKSAGQFIDALAKVSTLFTDLVGGRVSHAAYEISSLKWELQAPFLAILGKFSELVQSSSQLEAYHEGWKLSTDQITENYYFDWATRLFDILGLQSEMKLLKSELAAAKAMALEEKNVISGLLSPMSKAFVSLRSVCADKTSGFFSATDRLQFGKCSWHEVESLILSVESELVAAEKAISEASDQQKEFAKCYEQDLLPLQSKVTQLFDQYRTALRKLADLEEQLPKGAILPYQLPDALIDEDQYNQAKLATVAGSPVSVAVLQQELSAPLSEVFRFARVTAELDAETEEAIRQVRLRLDLIEKYRSAPIPTESPKVVPFEVEDDDDFERIYELVLACGYVMTYNSYVLSWTHPTALMGHLRYAGKISSEEYDLYHDAVCQKVAAESEEVPVQGITAKLRTAKAFWLQFPNIAKASEYEVAYKVTRQAEQISHRVLAQAGITKGDLDLWRKKRVAFQQTLQQHARRKTGRSKN